MPWNAATLANVATTLQQAALEGRFFPGKFIEKYPTDPEECPDGCGWGIITWATAVAHFGFDEARRLLPEGCRLVDVEHVLKQAGITDCELRSLAMDATWKTFDRSMLACFEERFKSEQDYATFIVESKRLARYFIKVISRVPVDDGIPVLMDVVEPESGDQVVTLSAA